MNTNTDNDKSTNVEGEEDDIIDGETVDEKVERLEKSNVQLFARAKKSEGFEQDADGKWIKKQAPAPVEAKPEVKPTPKSSTELSSEDVFVLVKAGIDEQDIEDVSEVAKLKKISIAEALKLPLTKQILADKAEQRKVAEGTNTGANKRGSSKLSDDQLLQNADKGVLPESAEDMNRLAGLQIRKNR
jgi:hypothetical protein